MEFKEIDIIRKLRATMSKEDRLLLAHDVLLVISREEFECKVVSLVDGSILYSYDYDVREKEIEYRKDLDSRYAILLDGGFRSSNDFIIVKIEDKLIARTEGKSRKKGIEVRGGIEFIALPVVKEGSQYVLWFKERGKGSGRVRVGLYLNGDKVKATDFMLQQQREYDWFEINGEIYIATKEKIEYEKMELDGYSTEGILSYSEKYRYREVMKTAYVNKEGLWELNTKNKVFEEWEAERYKGIEFGLKDSWFEKAKEI
jgi:hypothetical protein